MKGSKAHSSICRAGHDKSVTGFYKPYRCRECTLIQGRKRVDYNKAYWQVHPERRKEIWRTMAKKRTERMQALKNKPCTDCCGWFEPCQMDFDHRGNKIKAVSAMTNWSVKKLLVEISKCDLVCANCHRLRTQKRMEETVCA